MGRPKVRERLRYWFDNTMSRGTPALIAWLAVFSLALVVVFSALASVFDSKETTFRHALSEIWRNTVKTFKLGDAAHGTVPYRLLVILLSLAGLFFASALISLITAGVNRKITAMRKGRSVVMERGHTVVIGWSDQVIPIISELAEANANKRRGRVAILADRDRTEMEDEIRKQVRGAGHTKVVCRTGNPIDPADLDIVSPQASRAIIVLPPPGPTADAQVTKTLLAITNSPTRRAAPYHVVTAIRDPRNHAAVRLAGGGETVIVDADDFAARIIAQTCSQSGLSVVYQELLDIVGDEIYLAPAEPGVLGMTFGEALHAFPASAPIGLRRAAGDILINPDMETVIGAGDQIIAISEDDDTVRAGPWRGRVNEEAIMPPPGRVERPERVLMLGWNRRAAAIVRQLTAYLPAGSALDVIAHEPDAKVELDRAQDELNGLRVSFELGDTDDRAALDSFDVGRYDHVIVLCYDEPDAQNADSRALITLLHLRQMQADSGQSYSIVSEMSDDRNRQLAQVTKADDFIVSDKLISLLMVQLSENPHLTEVIRDLFDPVGTKIFLRPAADYVRSGARLDFHTVVESARRRGEVAVGYRLAARALEPPMFGVVLNPDKARPLVFGPDDRVIVLADGC